MKNNRKMEKSALGGLITLLGQSPTFDFQAFRPKSKYIVSAAKNGAQKLLRNEMSWGSVQ